MTATADLLTREL